MTDNGAKQLPASVLTVASVRIRSVMRRALGGILFIGIALGAYAYFYATHQQSYQTSRALRLLGSLSTQVGAKLRYAELFVTSAGRSIIPEGGAQSAARFIPAYQHLALGKHVAQDREQIIYASPNAQPCTETEAHQRSHGARWHHDPMAPPFCVHRSFAIGAGSGASQGIAYLNVATYLGADLASRAGFEKILLVDSSGQVLVEAGAPDITVTSLAALARGTGLDSAAGWAALTSKSSISEVTLAGKAYRLFLEPCCRLLDGSAWHQPFLVAGLVDKARFVRGSLKISLSLLTLVSAILVLLVLALPFLKFRLMGERQVVHVTDGAALAGAGFLAAGLVTIFAGSLFSYTKYRELRDEGLRDFSAQVTDHLRHEIAAGRDELASLYQRAATTGELSSGPPGRTISKDDSRYKFFESWSLVGSDGVQARKWSTDAFVQPMIPVGDRAYFVQTRVGRTWPAPVVGAPSGASSADSGKRYYLESALSRTTGKRLAVLAIPTGRSDLPVATLAMEMVSLINTVLPPGSAFAVINDSGRVLFHSDARRNLDERFFDEADDDRALRSAVLARTADTLNLTYDGRDHRAYVAPLPDLPWTLVTLQDKEPARITNAEILLGSLILLLAYTLLLTMVGALVLLHAPGSRLPWLWPDRRLGRHYLLVVAVDVLLLVAFLVACGRLDRDDLLLAGFLLPLTTLGANWAVLERSATSVLARATPAAVLVLALAALTVALLVSPVVGWAHYTIVGLALLASILALIPVPGFLRPPAGIARPYGVAAVLFLLLLGAMPGLAFFQVARLAHMEMLVKGGHLHLARQLEHRADSVRAAYSDALGAGKTSARSSRLCAAVSAHDLCGLDLYFSFFFGTRLQSAAPAIRNPSPATASSRLAGLFLAPYRPAASVAWRGTHAGAAADQSWSWLTDGERLRFLGSPAAGRGRVALESSVPDLRPRGSDLWLTAVLLGIAVLGIIVGMALFLAGRLFLVDVTDPVVFLPDRSIASLGGTNLFVVCRDADEEGRVTLPGAKTFDLQQRLTDGGDLRWVVESVNEGDAVLLRHFEYRHQDKDVTRAKLDLLDTLVHEYNCSVVAVSGQHPDGAPLGLRAARRLVESDQKEPTGPAAALESLVVIDAGRWLDCPEEKAERRWGTSPKARHKSAAAILGEEGRCDRHLRRAWAGLEATLEQDASRLGRQGREELLDLMAERAEPYYRGLWDSCRPGERSVLVHLARTGLVNEKDRRVLRRLLARGLIRRQPNFVVMNETFRRFLLARAEQVDADLPPQVGVWEAIRQPAMVLGTAVVILLFVTQQELFGATAALATALASGVASVTRISGLFDRRQAGRAA